MSYYLEFPGSNEPGYILSSLSGLKTATTFLIFFRKAHIVIGVINRFSEVGSDAQHFFI